MSISPLPTQSYRPLRPGPDLAPEKKPDAVTNGRPTPHESPEGTATRKGSTTTGTQAEPEPPVAPETLKKLRSIASLLSRDTLIVMMRDPYCAQSRQNLQALRSLLSEDSLKTLTKDPTELKQLRAAIGKVLSEKNISFLQRQAAAVHIPELTPERIRQRTSDPDPQQSYAANLQIEEELKKEDINIEHRTRQCSPLCKNLTQTGAQVRQEMNHKTTTVTPAATTATPSPETLEKMRRIVDLLSRENLIKMLREPNSEWTTRRVAQMRELLSKDSLKSLTKDPKELKHVEMAIENVFTEPNIKRLSDQAKHPGLST